jgi:hypothetical protein
MLLPRMGDIHCWVHESGSGCCLVDRLHFKVEVHDQMLVRGREPFEVETSSISTSERLQSGNGSVKNDAMTSVALVSPVSVTAHDQIKW